MRLTPIETMKLRRQASDLTARNKRLKVENERLTDRVEALKFQITSLEHNASAMMRGLLR